MTINDKFLGQAPGSNFPFTRAWPITPSNDSDLAELPRAIYVGGAGDLAVIMHGSSAPVTFKAVPVGTTLWIRARLVMSTNTTATQLLGLA